jgi:PncC family amidohydrolase
MADGVRRVFGSDVSLSVTGIAGPDGGTPAKPVGTVFICLSAEAERKIEKLDYPGDRETIRMRSVNKALTMLFWHLKEKGVADENLRGHRIS